MAGPGRREAVFADRGDRNPHGECGPAGDTAKKGMGLAAVGRRASGGGAIPSRYADDARRSSGQSLRSSPVPIRIAGPKDGRRLRTNNKSTSRTAFERICQASPPRPAVGEDRVRCHCLTIPARAPASTSGAPSPRALPPEAAQDRRTAAVRRCAGAVCRLPVTAGPGRRAGDRGPGRTRGRVVRAPGKGGGSHRTSAPSGDERDL